MIFLQIALILNFQYLKLTFKISWYFQLTQMALQKTLLPIS